jgi:NitT/TauT family transport system ATP-binding protein
VSASLSSLSLRNVSFSYGGTSILERISLDIPQGQFVTLLGASGSGKSTLLRLLAGLAKPREGELRWQNQPIKGPGLDRGVVFQDYSLFPWMSLIDNVALAVAKAKPGAGSSRAQRRDEAIEYLRKVGLDAALAKYPFELSGGMQQRAAIARALALGSPLLLMDEPFGALDPVNRARLQDLVLDIWETALPKKTIVFVTHDVDEALYLGDRVVILGASPARVIADLPVGFARRRDRQTLYHSADFHALREQIAEALNADTLQLLKAA